MNVVEIFDSIDGEGKRAGQLTTFIRFGTCNLRCNWCDTPYAQTNEETREMSVAEIMAHSLYRNITLTGGEPLIQEGINDLIGHLLYAGHNVNIETNGSVDIMPFYKKQPNRLLSNLFFTMDYKLPSSGMMDKMLGSNIEKLAQDDIIKFVVEDENDLHTALAVNDFNTIRAKKYLSPVFGKITPVEIVDFMKEHKMEDWILQLQLHKLIWDMKKRGV